MGSVNAKYIMSLILVVLCAGALFLFVAKEEKTENESTLIVGLQSGYPPFEMMDSDGNLIGFDIELSQALAAKLGKKLEIKDMEFDAEILSLKQGKINLIISGMNITADRLKQIAMVPYLGNQSSELTLVFWNSIPNGVETVDDLEKIAGVHVSVELGAVPEIFMQKHYPEIQLRSFHSPLSALMDIKFGKSTAMLVEPDVANYLKNEHIEIKTLPVTLSTDDGVQGFGIGIKKNNSQLITQVELAIQDMKKSGELKKLEDKWFKGASHVD